MSQHELKTWPVPFHGLWDGTKRHEVRTNDRDFRVGDVLVLREFDPALERYSWREIRAEVTFMTSGGEVGLPPNLCVMSIRELARTEWGDVGRRRSA